jgi:hypothetical protein
MKTMHTFTIRAFETATKDFWMEASLPAQSMNEALRIARNAIPTSPDSPLIYVVETE